MKNASFGRGFVLCVSGPSGSGKTSLCDRLAQNHPCAVRSISYTTRAQRPGETEGQDYHFVDQKTFERLESEDFFLESAKVYSAQYGTPLKPVQKAISEGKLIVMDIDTVGAKAVKERLGSECVRVFVLPPSLEELKKRLEGRAQNSQEDLERRLEEAKREMCEAPHYDYQIQNKSLEEAYLRLYEIVEAERKKLEG